MGNLSNWVRDDIDKIVSNNIGDLEIDDSAYLKRIEYYLDG